jgi:hypothetical protein
MKATIEVKDKREGELIKTALADPAARAFALTIGALLQLPTKRARMRALDYVRDYFEEQEAQPPTSEELPGSQSGSTAG